MPIKGQLKADHIPVSNYSLTVVGLPPLTITDLSGIEDELKTVELPDNTMASGGERTPNEFDVSLPTHHEVEELAMETWYQEGQHPISPTYKKEAILVMQSGSETMFRSFSLSGLFVKKRTLPDLEMGNDGEMAKTVWTLSFDDVLPTT